MKKFLMATAAAAVITLTAGAHAATITVFDTSLPDVNGAFGAGNATTTQIPGLGKFTTVIGPGGGANRASAPPVADQWIQRNVGGDAVVGIVTDQPRSGNGSAGFFGQDGDSKADLEYYFSSPIDLSAFGGLSYDWFRNSVSTAPDHLHPVIRLIVGGGTEQAPVGGYLVFERAYNPSVSPVPTNIWVTDTIDTTTINLWGTGNLPGAFADFDNKITDWLSAVPNLQVFGLSIGMGSGWNGGFLGYVDNVTFTVTGGDQTTWNFEVEQQGEVSEPATLALLAAGLGGLAAFRRRKSA